MGNAVLPIRQAFVGEVLLELLFLQSEGFVQQPIGYSAVDPCAKCFLHEGSIGKRRGATRSVFCRFGTPADNGGFTIYVH